MQVRFLASLSEGNLGKFGHEGRGNVDTEEEHVRREAAVMHPQAKALPRIARRRLVRGKEGIALRFRREHNPAHTFISDFWLPELGDHKFMLF